MVYYRVDLRKFENRNKIVQEIQILKHIKENMQRTGKSKSYINYLTGLSCPNGKRNCRYCGHSSKEFKKNHKLSKIIN